MPQRAWSNKRERQYEHIKDGLLERGEKEGTAEEIAARTVNKERARAGEAKESSRSSTDDISSGRRGGLRSHSGPRWTDPRPAVQRGPREEHRGSFEDEQGPARARRRPLGAHVDGLSPSAHRPKTHAILPTTIFLEVGCGGTESAWASTNRTPSTSVSSGAILYVNTTCNGTGSCTYFPLENNTPAAPTTNPVSNTSLATWRAAEYWHLMTSRYPNWGGNAGAWDDNAKATGWTVES